MRVALIGLRLTVGPRLIVDTLSPALRALGAEVLVLGERDYEAPEGVPCVPLTDGTTYGRMIRDTFRPRLYRQAANALAAWQPDVCYFVSVHPANALLARSLRRQIRAADGSQPRFAMHIHDPLPHPDAARAVIFAAQQMQVRMADYVVTYGAKLAEQVHQWYGFPRERILTVRHGASRAPRDTPPPEITPLRWFSFLGRIEPYKGLDTFLAAAQLVHATNPEARFYIGGSGDLRPYRRAIKALGKSVTVQNRELTNEETDEVMQSSWAAVLPYHSATQSGVIPVAYWNACPVIATDVGALGEVVRDRETGFMLKPHDPAGVAARMLELWGDRALRRRLSTGAFSFYDRWLRWERIAYELLRPLGFATEAAQNGQVKRVRWGAGGKHG